MPDSNQHNLPHGGATEGVSQADEGLGLRPAVDSEWSAGGAIPPAANQHAATLLAFVNETNEERIPSYDQVEAAVHGLVEQLQAAREEIEERKMEAASAWKQATRTQEQLKAERDARKGAMRDMGRAQSEAVEVLRELAELKEQNGALQHAIGALHNEVDCRIEHGAESGGHLEYVRTMLFSLMDDSIPASEPEAS